MIKVLIDRPGGHRQLKIREFPAPVPQPGEVLIAVSAAGVNFADVFIRLGLYQSAREFVGWPITPGFEVSGHVAACGDGVEDPAPGTPVVGVSLFGGYASHICIPSDQVYPVQHGSKFNLDQWAAFPTVFLTAYHGLFQNFVLRQKMNILVHSAAGGVGSALLQLGKLAGCRMIAVVGAPHKVDTAVACGADVVIDKSRRDLWPAVEDACPEGCDAVFDANGPSTLKQSYAHLAATGKLVIYGFHSMLSKKGRLAKALKLLLGYFQIPRWNPLHMTRDNKSIITFNLSYLFHRKDLLQEAMRDLIDRVEAGQIKAPPLQAFAIDAVADAHRALESGSTAGKLILKFQS
jgi:NADPH:quinone reductase-like Zn-dependent oxidoreductase